MFVKNMPFFRRIDNPAGLKNAESIDMTGGRGSSLFTGVHRKKIAEGKKVTITIKHNTKQRLFHGCAAGAADKMSGAILSRSVTNQNHAPVGFYVDCHSKFIIWCFYC
jgi:hypothetical protein